MNIKSEVVDLVREFLVIKLTPVLIFIFGSAVEGHFSAESDIDLAFLSDKEVSSYEVFTIAQELANIVSRDVDLIDLKKASEVLRAQIVGKGEVIYSLDSNIEDEFKIRVFKDYALLK